MNKPLRTSQRLWVLALILVATWLYTWGLQRNLPYANEADESVFVERAVVMLNTNDLNPRWFGHPGSTIFYPLLALYQGWYWVYGSDMPDLPHWFAAQPWLFYYLARLLSVAYTLLALPLTYQLGRQIFNPTTGIIGMALLLSYPNVLFHIKSVRTDGVGMTFALLTIWACLQVYRRPTLRQHLLAGVSLGLGIASRYFLVLFMPLLLWLSWCAWRNTPGKLRQSHLLILAAGLFTICLSFALSTPYFFLDFAGAWQGLLLEGRSTHPGADGLSRIQNFLWYWEQIARSEYRMLQSVFALVGLSVIAIQRSLVPLSLVGTLVIFLGGISLSPLHWLRWALPILPLAALVSAHGLVTTAAKLTQVRWQRFYHPLLLGLTIASVAAPGLRSIQLSIQDATPSTRMAARLWLLQHLPPAARLIQEPYTALLMDDPRVTNRPISLGSEQTVDGYRQAGYTHLVISSAMYNRFLAAAERYPKEVAFYQSLLQERKPLATFTPTWRQGGPTLLIYAIAVP